MTAIPMRAAKALDRVKDHVHFASAWLNTPRRTGAIAPSSTALARQMAFAAAVQPGGRVVELGPGTGVVTRALLEAGVSEDELLLVELNVEFAMKLAKRYPRARVVVQDAFTTLEALVSAGEEVASIVSSLPLLTYKKDQRRVLCDHAMRLVGPHGRLVQYSYGLGSPITPTDDIRAMSSRRVWSNLPSAVVWTYQAGCNGSPTRQ